MLEAALITLMVMAGAALISYFTAVLMTDYTRQGEYRKLYRDFTWLVFRRTMIAMAAIAASAFGLFQADDIIRAVAALVYGPSP